MPPVATGRGRHISDPLRELRLHRDPLATLQPIPVPLTIPRAPWRGAPLPGGHVKRALAPDRQECAPGRPHALLLAAAPGTLRDPLLVSAFATPAGRIHIRALRTFPRGHRPVLLVFPPPSQTSSPRTAPVFSAVAPGAASTTHPP